MLYVTHDQCAPKVKRRVPIETPFDRCEDTLEARRGLLIEHLQTALELEHGTIPPYLCALYSIKDGTNRESAERIRSVALEEMLHMVLVANLTNAIGGTPTIARPDFLMKYPGRLPKIDENVEVSLNRFSEKAIDVFLDIERPTDIDAAPKGKDFSSIGQFYAAIKDELDRLNSKYSAEEIFIGDPALQISPADYYSGGGEIVPVSDYRSARRAIKVIVDEGEGFRHSFFSGDHEQFGEERDLAHFYKFNEIKKGQRYKLNDDPAQPTGEELRVDYTPNAVYPAQFLDELKDYPSDIQPELKEFHRTYSRLLRAIDAAFIEKRNDNDGASPHFQKAVGLMYDVKRQMIRLMKIPIDNAGNTAGPTFVYVEEDE